METLTGLFAEAAGEDDDYGLRCVYPHYEGLRSTAGEYPDPPKDFADRGTPKTWTQHRQYSSEHRAQVYLPRHEISSPEEAQEIADKVTKAAGVRPITVSHDPSYNYSFQQTHPHYGGRSRIVLGNGGMNHLTLLHELAHHVDDEKDTYDPEEGHGESFHNHLLDLVRQHHPQGQAAEWQLKDSFHAVDKALRMGWKGHLHQPDSEENPEMTEKEKALPEVERPKPLWGDEHHDPLTRDLATFASDNGDHYPKHNGGEYPRFDPAKGPIGEQVIARSTDKQLADGLNGNLVRPQHLEHWLKYYPDREGLKQRWTEANGYDHYGDMLNEVYGDETHHTASASAEWIAEWGGGPSKPCPCCHGTGEHDEGECQLCDGGMTVSHKTPDDAQGRDCFRTSAQKDGRTVRMVPPEEYRKFHFPDYPTVKGGLGGLVRHFKKTDPDYYNKVKGDVQANGFTTPILVQYKDPAGRPLAKPYVREGHHRAAVAHELGLHLPVGDYDNEADFQHSRAGNAEWFKNNERGPQGMSWNASLHRRVAEDDPGVHRGLTVVLPEHVHRFVHDQNQPAAARAHMLLSEVRKQNAKNTSEDVEGTTGGLGNYWSPSRDKAHEFAIQGGFGAYKEHELKHNCGDEDYGHGGCPTTNVLLHADTPSDKHHWHEVFREGERYDPELSWRLPVRPGAPMNVRGISWREGNDHWRSADKYSSEGFQHAQKAPYEQYDFTHSVKKRASAPEGFPEGTRGVDNEGHDVEMTAMDGWAHLDGSHGHEDNTNVGDHPVHTENGVWMPSGRYWGPNSEQNDQRLFDGDHLRPEIRQDILGRLNHFFDDQGYADWREWAKVYFAGSEAAKWAPFNGDFDIIIGINWPEFREANPQHGDESDIQAATAMTDGLWKHANVDGYYFHLDGGKKVGPFDRTFFVNPLAWDIRKLHPYAAYDVTDDRWAVEPLKVPKDWSAASLPSSYWEYADALVKEIDAIGKLPPEERARMAQNLWEEIHTHRSDAFSDGGKGMFDISNILEKYLQQAPSKPWDRLRKWRSAPAKGPEPFIPTTASSARTVTEPDGADYSGVMIALVPPQAVCESLAVDGGEPVSNMHITLAYLGGKEDMDEDHLAMLPHYVQAWARTQKPLTARVGGVGTFVNPDEHVLWAAVDIPRGTVFRDSLVDFLEGRGYDIRHDHGWTPHLTMAYGNTHFRFLPKIEPAEWEVTEVWCCVGGDWKPFPLGS